MDLNQSSRVWKVVTPNDSADFAPHPCKALYFGGAGNVVVVDPTGADATITVVAGGYLTIETKRVKATSTTATSIVALF